ncbi:MAG: low molecular weight phosphotyrosine protein phosphatase [Flavobacteriales bacterium]|jgi:protein-tyrosine phosphatase|nr:low molecular weight phosphotyrosine protein phosphatase [Flavobacteriales bacterium]
MRILLVCLGNICRSPMAEGILRERARQRGLVVITDSAGTSDHHVGEAPDPRAQAAMERQGMQIGDLRARQYHPDDLRTFDLILAMDANNLRDILHVNTDPSLAPKAKLMMDLVPIRTERDVPDPYFGGDDGFDHVFRMLDSAVNSLLDDVQR